MAPTLPNEGTPREYQEAREDFCKQVARLAREHRYARFHVGADLVITVLLRKGGGCPVASVEVPEVWVEPRDKVKLARE